MIFYVTENDSKMMQKCQYEKLEIKIELPVTDYRGEKSTSRKNRLRYRQNLHYHSKTKVFFSTNEWMK